MQPLVSAVSRSVSFALLVTPVFAQFPYGTGTAGSGGFTPRISSNQAWAGRGDFAVAVDRGLGGAVGLVVVGLAPDSSAFAGLPVYVDQLSVVTTQLMLLGGAGAGTGTGSVTLSLAAVSTSFVGLSFFAQAALTDPLGPGFGGGWSATGGLEVVITREPQVFAACSVSGSTDPHWAVNGLTGAIDWSGGNQFTNNADGAAYTTDGRDLYVSSGFGQLAHADLSTATPA